MKDLISLLFLSAISVVYAFENYDPYANDVPKADSYYPYGQDMANDGYGRGYGPHAGGNYAQFGKFGYGGDGGFNGVNYGGYNGVLGQYGQYMGGGGNPLVSEAMYGGGPQRVAGGQFNLGFGGIKSPLAPIVNSAYQGNYSPMKKFGFGGFGGVDNFAAAEINDYRFNNGDRPLDPDDLDNDNEADFLTATKHKIDNYLAKQYLMGRRKLTVSVNYANMPLEYQYLSQFHGFPNPVAGTPLGKKFGLTTQRNTYNNPRSAGAFTPAMQPPKPYMQQMAAQPIVTPQVATPSIPGVPGVPVNMAPELGLDETTEPEAEPEVAGAATNQTAAENQDRQANMAGSISNVPGMGQTAYMPGQMTGQMGQMTGQMPGQTAGQMGQMTGQMPGQMGQTGYMTGQMTGQMPGQTPGQTGQMSGQPGQMGQMSGQMPGQMGQMPGQIGQMGQMVGQMGQSGQMGGPMASMFRLLGQGGHQNQFMGGLGGMMNQHNPYPQSSMWQQHSMGGQSAMGQNSMFGNVGSKPIPFSMNQQPQMGGQNNWGQMNQNPMNGFGQNSMGQNAPNAMAGQIGPVHQPPQPTHYGTQYNSAMPVMASASSSQDSSSDSTHNDRKKK